MTPLNEASGVANGLAGGDFVGSGPARPRHPALVAALSEASSEQAINLLSVSDSDITKVLQILESPPLSEVEAYLAGLFTSATSAAAGGDVPKASAHLAALVALDPRRAETLALEPALASIRSEVIHLLTTLTFAAKADAEARLDQARQSTPTVQSQPQESRAIQPEVALLFAERLIGAGGYSGFVHSAELSQLVLNYGLPTPPYFEAPTPKLASLNCRSRACSPGSWLRSQHCFCSYMAVRADCFRQLCRASYELWPPVLIFALALVGQRG